MKQATKGKRERKMQLTNHGECGKHLQRWHLGHPAMRKISSWNDYPTYLVRNLHLLRKFRIKEGNLPRIYQDRKCTLCTCITSRFGKRSLWHHSKVQRQNNQLEYNLNSVHVTFVSKFQLASSESIKTSHSISKGKSKMPPKTESGNPEYIPN